MPDTLLGGIAINEVLVDPNGANNFDTDGDGVARGRDEFVELINTSGAAIDISGLELWDAGRDNWFTFPPGTVLEAGARALVVRDVQSGGSLPAVTGDDLAFDAAFGRNVFNNAGDNIVVYDPANDEFIQATFNGDTLDDPTVGPRYAGFSPTATRVGAGEDFGSDIDGFSIQRTETGFANDGVPTPGAENICFASGTRLHTPQGFRPIETLRAGDLVLTRDAGPQPIRWIFFRRVSRADLRADPNLAPICIKGDRFAGARLSAPLRVSRHHRVLISGPVAHRMFGAREVLVPAKDLLDLPMVTVDRSGAPFYYAHVLLDGHHILNANGLATESLLLGPQACHALSDAAKAELALLFPDGLHHRLTRPTRPLAQGHQARALIRRHRRNAKPALVVPA